LRIEAANATVLAGKSGCLLVPSINEI